MEMTLVQLLKLMVDKGGSDLHLAANSSPRIRVTGVLLPLNSSQLSSDQTKELCLSVLTDKQKSILEKNKEVDIAFNVKGLARFRGNIYLTMGTFAASFRMIPNRLMTMDELKMPKSIVNLCHLQRGLIFVTGPSGSGKSTTVNAMIDYMNKTREDHILTVEDPVEFMHVHDKCMITQRNVGQDTTSHNEAIKGALRQDPDIIYLGELRDLDAMQSALTIAETGHLVIACLHTNGSISTLNRIVDLFPAAQHNQIRSQLSITLSAIISQQLIRTRASGQISVMEVLIPNIAIRSMIADDKLNQIYSQMQSGQEETGMQTMNQELFKLIKQRLISRTVALDFSPDQAELVRMLESAGYVDAKAS